jgi:DnaJ-class molecular chaperone
MNEDDDDNYEDPCEELDEEEEYDDTCTWCGGTGEGMYDGASCRKCHGTGIEPRDDDYDDI